MKQILSKLVLVLVVLVQPVMAAELIRVPLHIHYLKSSVPEINAPKEQVDLKNLLKEANEIWKLADIEFFIKEENVVEADEKAAKAYASLFGLEKIAFQTQSNRQLDRAIPDLKGQVFHVVFLHTMPLGFGGRYFPDRGFVLLPQVKYAKHIKSPTGKFPDGTTERPQQGKVFAHELGHAMSLMHCNLNNNLMTSGPQARGIPRGIELVDQQIFGARKIALRGRPFLRKESELMTRVDSSSAPQAQKQNAPASRRQPPPYVRVMNPDQRRSFSDLMRQHRAQFEVLSNQRSEARRSMHQALYANEPNEKAVHQASRKAAEADVKMALLSRKLISEVKPPLNERQLKSIRRWEPSRNR